MNPCPICFNSTRKMPFYQYRLVCEKCWAGVRNYKEAATQLQLRLTFIAAIANDTLRI